jgi:hypothetical protein
MEIKSLVRVGFGSLLPSDGPIPKSPIYQRLAGQIDMRKSAPIVVSCPLLVVSCPLRRRTTLGVPRPLAAVPCIVRWLTANQWITPATSVRLMLRIQAYAGQTTDGAETVQAVEGRSAPGCRP